MAALVVLVTDETTLPSGDEGPGQKPNGAVREVGLGVAPAVAVDRCAPELEAPDTDGFGVALAAGAVRFCWYWSVAPAPDELCRG